MLGNMLGQSVGCLGRVFLFLFGILHGVVPQSAKAWRRAAPRSASARERATRCAGTRGASGRWPGSTHGCYAHAVGTCAASSARCPQADCLEGQDSKSEVTKDACEELTSGPHGPKDYKTKSEGNKPGHNAQTVWAIGRHASPYLFREAPPRAPRCWHLQPYCT